MQKVIKLLEKHVQWVALGLAGLYLLWMAWTYVIHVPAQVKIGKEVLDPGSINAFIKSDAIAPLDREVQQKNDDFHIEVPNLLTPWLAAVNSAPTSVAVLPSVFPPNAVGGIGIAGPTTRKDGAVLAALPKLPPAEPVAVGQVRTTVIYPDPAWVAPKNNPQAVPVPITEHKDVISAAFKIKQADLTAAFAKEIGPTLPPQLNSTMFLQVVLTREELHQDGSWGNPETIPPLLIHPMNKFPGDKAKPITALEYQEWASTHQTDIQRPAFYQVATGSKAYEEPGLPPAPVNPAGQPGAYTPPPIAPTLTPPGAPAGPARPGTPTRKPGGAAAGGTTGTPPSRNPQRPGQPPIGPSMQPPQPTYQPPYQPPTQPPYQPPYQPTMPPNGIMQPPMFSGAPGQQGPGLIDVSALQNDIRIIAHDETVVEGKTYRYTVTYKLLNSAYNATKIVASPTMAEVFALTSPVSKPTDNITVPTRTDLFVKNIRQNEVKFDVFQWKGAETMKEVSASPGDLVLPTGWTVVDIRQDLKSHDQAWYVILVNPSGVVSQHSARGDQSDQRYKDLLDLVKTPEARAN